MADANLYAQSELIDGAIIHPTLPMSFLGEIIPLPDGGKTASFTYNFTTINTYTDPFFILVADTSRYFYYNITGSGNNFTLECERSFTYVEGRYKFYTSERETGVITMPLFENARIYVGGVRG